MMQPCYLDMNCDNTYKQIEGQNTDAARFVEGLVEIYSYSYS